ncbi:glycerol-3-phosphate dehydrogenase [Actibacterium mucosum KCTC 23349]|uniref:Glycerol-3-phosphate dehydrogenase n=1 Tax=Actibacterium mucosum KCTC 23349 TaxID=1454373 RepID=A0A037ZL34_9RHOB|nr:glycerol-3-phosphate dehydrogenase/oxidase [Actibacterium mucosum]KAJ56329.1 glycerol-3-phosphate dehydrogenase [Actibacterium mucosum KCTC 23349]
MSDQRAQNLAKLRANSSFDVVVVGGGVNGIGVFRDLALQGLRVLLVERNDFCSGCSAAPSRMIHGGLRYLENGEFSLVRESLHERDALLRNAPHMVRALPTMIPITSWASGLFNSAASFLGRTGKPAARGAIPIKVGLALYDWVTRKRRLLPAHRFHGRASTRANWPDLMPNARLSAVYNDAWISHPERLCIELLQDTLNAAPVCVALNYAELHANGRGVVLHDNEGQGHIDIEPKVIVNATGAWVDDTARGLGAEGSSRMVSGTKGSHLILKHDQLRDALNGHMVYFENTDGRVCIVFPYQGQVLAGSTDIRVETPGRVRCEDDERDYILTSLRLIFPQIEIAAQDIVFSYSGIRPLPKSNHEFTGRISRGHDVRRLPGKIPQFCMIGGKWTTFRAFAEQTADQVLEELGVQRRISTRNLPIGGGKGFSDDAKRLAKNLGIPETRAVHLLDHYGSHAEDVARFLRSHPDMPLATCCPYTVGEIRWLVGREFVQTVSDIVLRRTSLAITGQISMDVIDRICEVFAAARGLSTECIGAQKEQLINELAEFHGVTAEALTARNTERRRECV